ncbi:MAG: DNA helicase [Bdellovibrionaceae bacterium]|nr:DNA helicase [Pseudobdellovibrionaceae bacterium]
MKLSAPIHVLKIQAKKIKKEENITLAEALNRIAQQEGFISWSLLQAKSSNILPQNFDEILSYFNAGDLVIIGARPQYGKTNFAIGLFVKAIQEKRVKSYYFSLAETHKSVADRIANYDELIGMDNSVFELNYSNDICADYIISKTNNEVGKNSVIVVDYLQLLDEKRINAPLQEQIEKLKSYAKEKQCIIIFISQLDRKLESKINKSPTDADLRLPNPLDLSLINKRVYLSRKSVGSKEVEVTISGKYKLNVRWDNEKIKFV